MGTIRIACDIGGTNGRVAAYPADSIEMLEQLEFKISGSKTRRSTFQIDSARLLDCVSELQGRHGIVTEMGLAVAGKVSPDRKRLLLAGALEHWVSQAVTDYFSYALPGVRVVLGNDAEAAAMADAVYGLGAQDEFRGVPFQGMIWGSGVGGACVRYGRDGSYITIPMEPGHIVVDSRTMARNCGHHGYGHLEAYCGGNNIFDYYGKRAEELSEDLWSEVTEWMSVGIETLLLAQPVSLLVFSGGVACGQFRRLQEMEGQFHSAKYGFPKFRLSAFGESAGTLGALSLLNL